MRLARNPQVLTAVQTPAAAPSIALTNGTVDVLVRVDCGPRIVRFGPVGGENLLADAPGRATPTRLGTWEPVGGHRLWVAPERTPGSYAPDRVPVAWEQHGDRRGRFTAPVDAAGIEKHLHVEVAPHGTVVRILHRIVNRTCWPVQVAPWAITVVDPGGAAVMPQPAFRSHVESFLPARRLVQWSYTDFGDPRLQLGRRLVRLHADAERATPQKIGAANQAGWSALVRRGLSFIKHASWIPHATYPDEGCHTEFFTAGAYLEMETLAPLCILEPDGVADHVETWMLTSGIDADVPEDVQESQIVAALERVQATRERREDQA